MNQPRIPKAASQIRVTAFSFPGETASQIRARRMLKADGNVSKWWTELSPEAQEEYVAEHPNSKYADMKKKADDEAKSKSSNPDQAQKPNGSDPKQAHQEALKHNKELLKKAQESDTPEAWEEYHNSTDALDKTTQDSLSKVGREGFDKYLSDSKKADGEKPLNEEFPVPKAGDPELKIGSPFRKAAATFLRKKSANIVSHLKHEAKEWKHAGHALTKIATGKGLDHEDKHAIASVAADIALITTSILVTGGAAHGIAAFFKHFGTHMAQEALMKAAVKGVVTHASVMVTSAPAEDQILENALKIMMDELENGNLDGLMKKYGETSKAKPGQTEIHPTPEEKAPQTPKPEEQVQAAAKLMGSTLDMSENAAGKGLCPERDCGKPMTVALVANGDKPIPSYICTACRVSLPLPNTHAFYQTEAQANVQPVRSESLVDKIRALKS